MFKLGLHAAKNGRFIKHATSYFVLQLSGATRNGSTVRQSRRRKKEIKRREGICEKKDTDRKVGTKGKRIYRQLKADRMRQ